ncbi:WD repeat-containing protein DWA2 [Amborella trichopoda]|uniref:WD repeat-containing protein DWA2 n=1 Tax=Amborella trichopoda TaxID=13333 RepID=UPI0005D43D8A|nr:WD repeat-containing protein DWA2 [Amborella trichopoda]XP_020532211.1 WD repeat-containing protein DWA2 [Amborella trichopoda]|eukprot:XP_011628967.1 WD repeat-containing protein DWA2 [Amborella trichopoda]
MQGGSTGVGYGLKYQARCITDIKADRVHTSFLAGTLSLKEENEVHLIQLSPSGTELNCEGLFYHPHEIWHLADCPFNPRIFSTVYASGGTYGAALWEIPELYNQSNAPQLEQLVSLDAHNGKIKCIIWWPLGMHDKVIGIDEENLVVWSLDTSAKSAKVHSQESVDMPHYFSGGAWDPHDQNSLATTCESAIQCWDLRTMKKTISIEHANVRSADYNPNKQHLVVTAEDESGLRIWDFRMPKVPVREISGHAHWTWSVQHNPKYDELILSAGTDSAVNLWLASSNNGEGPTSESLLEPPTRHIDPLIHSYNDYEDSVYGLAWSSKDPSVFASISYDGRVVVESVKPHIPKR